MSGERLAKAAVAAAAVAAVARRASAVETSALDVMVQKISSDNDDVRGAAWQEAWRYGPPAVDPLAELMTHDDYQIARAAKRGLWKLVRHSGRPGAELEAKLTIERLLPLVAEGKPYVVRREAAWMLSEVAGDEAVDPVAAMLGDKDLREDARMVLQRLPGEKSLNALKTALKEAPEDFKINIAQSLRARGVTVDGYPCQKMVPTRETNVEPVK